MQQSDGSWPIDLRRGVFQKALQGRNSSTRHVSRVHALFKKTTVLLPCPVLLDPSTARKDLVPRNQWRYLADEIVAENQCAPTGLMLTSEMLYRWAKTHRYATLSLRSAELASVEVWRLN